MLYIVGPYEPKDSCPIFQILCLPMVNPNPSQIAAHVTARKDSVSFRNGPAFHCSARDVRTTRHRCNNA
jgi:hypothetical protein